MAKLLVTGGSGFLGKRIVQKYCALAPSHSEMDITRLEGCLKYFDIVKPEVVIHCAAISDTGYCAQHPEEGFLVNVQGTENVAQACAQYGAKLIFASSDQVYSNGSVPHTESEEVQPAGIYGEMKREAEKRVLNLLAEAVCLRFSWMYDVPQSERLSFLDQLQSGSSMRLSDCEHRGITWVMEVVDQLPQILQLPGGIYNAGSPNRFTTFETGMRIQEKLCKKGCNASVIERGDWHRNLAMDISKIQQYGVNFSDTLDRLLRWIE